MEEGWIKLHRSTTKWGWRKDPNVFSVWMHILLNANFCDSIYKGYPILAGQLAAGYPSLSDKTGLSIQNVRTAISKLKSTGEITVSLTPLFSIITVNKWSEYQASTVKLTGDQQAPNSLSTGDQQASNSQLTPSKEYKNEIMKEGNNGIINNSDVLSEPEIQKPKKIIKKDYGQEFEHFWKTTKYPIRPRQDLKGDMFDKYKDLIKKGCTSEDILFACDIYAEANKDNSFPMGLRKFLDSKMNIDQYLNEDVSRGFQQKTDLQKSFDRIDAMYANMPDDEFPAENENQPIFKGLLKNE